MFPSSATVVRINQIRQVGDCSRNLDPHRLEMPPPFPGQPVCVALTRISSQHTGISPSDRAGRSSPQSLRGRLRKQRPVPHLRRRLGCLLADKLGIELRRVGSGERHTFTNPGERKLDDWMADHAFVVWIEADEPWAVGRQILASDLSLPLNLDSNTRPEHIALLSGVRRKARERADELPIVVDSGGPRRMLPVIALLPR